MPKPVARSQKVDRLLAYLCDGVSVLSEKSLEDELGQWLSASDRFLGFADANRDKIRKKLRVSSEPAARSDVRAELLAAFLLLADRRIELSFEAYGRERRGPDFTVTFRASHHFNLEVTRPRLPDVGADRTSIVGNALLGKLRQLPVDSPNALLVATALAASDDEIATTMRALKLRADRHEEEFFARRGLSTAEFQLYYRRLGLLLVGNLVGPGVHTWVNPEARRNLPDGATAACIACLANARWMVDG